MLSGVLQSTWLNEDKHFAPGRELFRSERRFSVWAYTVSHSQLLLRASRPSGSSDVSTQIDLLFKSVDAVKLQMDYAGLMVRCATGEEQERITQENGLGAGVAQVFVIESGSTLGHVVSGAVGWREDEQVYYDPSTLAFFPPGTDPTRILPTDAKVPWSTTYAARMPE